MLTQNFNRPWFKGKTFKWGGEQKGRIIDSFKSLKMAPGSQYLSSVCALDKRFSSLSSGPLLALPIFYFLFIDFTVPRLSLCFCPPSSVSLPLHTSPPSLLPVRASHPHTDNQFPNFIRVPGRTPAPSTRLPPGGQPLTHGVEDSARGRGPLRDPDGLSSPAAARLGLPEIFLSPWE